MHSLELVTRCDLEQVLFHNGRIPGSLEPHDDFAKWGERERRERNQLYFQRKQKKELATHSWLYL